METNKQKIGNMGEEMACEFLKQKGYKILDRNYRKKWGEIDIVAKKDDIIHFVEVKSVSRVTGYLPEESIHPWKRKRLGRAIQTYLLEKKISEDLEWQTDSLAVFLDFKTRKAKFRFLENIIL
ncbi:YraN family protein [Patescibacteria group bacterium]|nr:YraN family protein [Patescibacteria group bacterium]MBU2263478.1 YraN family protein [Patescibacteria group bacterium]